MADGQHDALAQLIDERVKAGNARPGDVDIFGHDQMRGDDQLVIVQRAGVQFQAVRGAQAVQLKTQ